MYSSTCCPVRRSIPARRKYFCFRLIGNARLVGRRPINAWRGEQIGEVIEAVQANGEHGGA